MSDTQSQENVIDSPNTHGTPTSASPGELLARQREKLGIPLADAARALNLRPAVVAGLEQDDYQEMPVAAYRRGYLRSYAKFLGMDELLVLEAYQARSGVADTERKVNPVSTARPPSRVGAWLFKLVTLLVIAGLIAVTVMWWQSRGGNEPPGFGSTPPEETPTASSQAPTASAEPAREAAETEESADSSFASGDQSATTLPSDAASITPSSTTEQDQANGAQRDADATAERDEATLDSDSGAGAELSSTRQNDSVPSATEQDSTESEQTAAAEQTANANVLELTFNEQSWTEIFDATNQRVFVGLQAPGTSTTVEGKPPFRLTVGNATGVELRYQGQEVDLTARAGANNVARFTLGE